mgnify:CR=1 FL=1
MVFATSLPAVPIKEAPPYMLAPTKAPTVAEVAPEIRVFVVSSPNSKSSSPKATSVKFKNATGGDFVKGHSKATVSFKLKND